MQQSTDWLHVVAKAVAFDSVPLNPVVSDADGFAICDVQSTWSADPYSLYSTVADQGVSVTRRVIQIGESEVPFVSLRTLLVHDKALLGVLPERDTEFTQIRGITNVASSHRNVSHPMSPLSSHSSVCIGSTSAIHLQIQKKQSHACRCEHKRDEPLLEKTVHRNSQDHSAGRASHMRGCV